MRISRLHAFALAVVFGLSVPIVHAQNPLATPTAQQQQRPFAGAFVGENISLDLSWDGAQEAYTGWLTFKGQKYACGGLVNNSILSGQFVANGSKYPFSVAINADGVILTSDNHNYPMKRQQPAKPAGGDNPFAGDDKDKNPFGGGGGAGGGNPDNPFAGGGAVNPQPQPANPNAIGGVGILFKQDPDDGAWMIAEVMPGGPAAKANLKPGWYLEAVDGKSVEKLSMEQVRGLVTGKVGTEVKLTIETDTKTIDLTLVRADLSGGAAPQPGPQPGPQPAPIAGGGGIPGFPGGGQQQPNAGPAWMKPGTRITYWSGSASIPGATQVLGPDPNGNWVNAQGQRFSPQDNPGAGGYGYQQLTFANINNGMAVVDARSFLINPQDQTVTGISTTGYVLPVNNGGEYWMDPRQLAQMQNGPQGAVTIFRGPYKLGEKQFNVVRITTKVATGWTQSTYDADSGLMISTGSSTMGQGQALPGPNGQSTVGGQTNNITQGFLVGMRQLTNPWIGQRGTRDLAQLRGMEFGGTYVTEIPQVPAMPWGFSLRWDISKIDEWSVTMRQSTAIDYRNGAQPQPNIVDRTGSLTNIWIDPQVLGRMQAGQVLDEDPFTKFKLSVVSAQNGSVVLTEQNQVEQSFASYDMRSGLINGMQSKQRVGIAVNTITLQRTR